MRHMLFLSVVFGVLICEGTTQGQCRQIGFDECCNRSLVYLPCTVCNFPQAPHNTNRDYVSRVR